MIPKAGYTEFLTVRRLRSRSRRMLRIKVYTSAAGSVQNLSHIL